ncbi:hypothetical protein HELRODRAFT_78143, partial [Helobdella robusta]|uniref:C2 domain-containing protein n=1 Tax=Helobdella robusta TaxID=6412 RepID=T1G387_HELRO
QLQMSYDKFDSTLNIHVIQGRRLKCRPNGSAADPFVKIYLLPGRNLSNRRCTKYITRTSNPEWHQTLVFMGLSRYELSQKNLEVSVWDYDKCKNHYFLGETVLHLEGWGGKIFITFLWLTLIQSTNQSIN